MSLGNDVVDLALTVNLASASNPRYLARVLGAGEQRYLARAPQPNQHLIFWALWAAKEASYKALKRQFPEIGFLHRRFIVLPGAGTGFRAMRGRAVGIVRHSTGCVPVRWAWNREWMHCIAGSRSKQATFQVQALSKCRKMPLFEHVKASGTLSDASVAVRVLAKTMLADRGIHDVSIEREHGARTAPQIVRQGDTLAGVSLSLSHEGRFVAAAIQNDLDLHRDGAAAEWVVS